MSTFSSAGRYPSTESWASATSPASILTCNCAIGSRGAGSEYPLDRGTDAGEPLSDAATTPSSVTAAAKAPIVRVNPVVMVPVMVGPHTRARNQCFPDTVLTCCGERYERGQNRGDLFV